MEIHIELQYLCVGCLRNVGIVCRKQVQFLPRIGDCLKLSDEDINTLTEQIKKTCDCLHCDVDATDCPIGVNREELSDFRVGEFRYVRYVDHDWEKNVITIVLTDLYPSSRAIEWLRI